MQRAVQKFDRWGFPIRTSEAELYRRAVLGQKAQPLNIKFEPHSERMDFSINPITVALPNGVIEAIRVQDIEKQVYFEYNRATGWTAPPEVTVGTGKLYIAAYYLNNGGPGKLHMGINDDVADVIRYKEEHVETGAYAGIETGTINMPNRTYGITVDVAP